MAVIKFNRPKSLNAVNTAVLSELRDALSKIAHDPDIGALGPSPVKGDRSFVAGADISEMVNLTPIQLRKFSRNGQEVLFALEALPIPVIACVNGFALGGGTEISMACDFIYASEKAKFGQPEITLGVIPGFGGTQRLSRLVGKSMAKELCMTGVIISAQEAKDIGLVNKVFAPEELWEATMKVAIDMAKKGKVSMRAAKRCIDRGYDVDLHSGSYMEADCPLPSVWQARTVKRA